MQNRRAFLRNSVLSTVFVSASSSFAAGRNEQAGPEKSQSYKSRQNAPLSTFENDLQSLLKTWSDGMLQHQVHLPADKKIHGALWCPACQKIHGRCMDAVYPFAYMAKLTGEDKYREAAEKVMQWSDNVSLENGAWTVIPDPKSWAGITVFGAIALAETLHYHKEVFSESTVSQWYERLRLAIDYVYREFDMTFTNINYGMTALYALNFIGRELNEKKYVERSRELAKQAPRFFTEPNKFLFGEMKPSTHKSKKGLYGVDLGYNVEETFNGLVQYALLEQDEPLLALAEESMYTHLKFMMPDGAWDNSWGTRQSKWSYWGSRTTDGCQIAFSLMNSRNSGFGTAAAKNLELLRRCTHDGLLHGGLHYDDHGVLPCIHHTFSHAKVPTALLDSHHDISSVDTRTPLPISQLKGKQFFPEIEVWQVAEGPWKASLSAYDARYRKDSQGAAGGSIGFLYHDSLGPIFTASMTDYILVERNNQQFDPDDEDIALTPRLELEHNDSTYTNLWDLAATIVEEEKGKAGSGLSAKVTLTNNKGEVYRKGHSELALHYRFNANSVTIESKVLSKKLAKDKPRLVLPVICSSSESYAQKHAGEIEFNKKSGKLRVKTDGVIRVRETKRDRTFNHVPGFQAIVLDIAIADEPIKVEITA